MDSRRRSYLIAAAITVIAMIVAAVVVGVPGCKGSDPVESGPINQTSTSEVPQDPNAGEGEVYKEEYGETGPQRAGTISMANVPGTGATVLYDMPTSRQIVYRTKSKGVGGSVSSSAAASAPPLSQTMQMLTARNPAIVDQKITKAPITIDGAKGTKVVQSLGRPTNVYSITAVAKDKGQIITISALGPLAKKATVQGLFDSLVEAITIAPLSKDDQAAAAKAKDDSTGNDKAPGGNPNKGATTQPSTTEEGDIPIPAAPKPGAKKKPGAKSTQTAPQRVPVS